VKEKLSLYKRNIRNYIVEIKKAAGIECGSNFLCHLYYFFRWNKYLYDVEHVLDNDMPWFNFAAVDYLERLLVKNMRVFEYSSGGSTFFFAKRVLHVCSVEHNNDWYDNVINNINRKNISNCRIKLIEPEPMEGYSAKDHRWPDSYLSSDTLYRDQSFMAYAQSIDAFPDEHFDVVLIDGRARPSCFSHAHNKVRVGGHLILDNSEREEYGHIHASLDNENWDKTVFFGPGPYVVNFWGTTFWRRKA
jgi:hypothetical protein